MVTPVDTGDLIGPYIVSAATIASVQNLLKSQPVYQQFVQAFPGSDKWAHWTVAAGASLLAAAGIHYTLNYDPNVGGVLTFQLPKLLDMLHGLADFFKVFILQHVVYKATRTAPVAETTVLAPVENVTIVKAGASHT